MSGDRLGDETRRTPPTWSLGVKAKKGGQKMKRCLFLLTLLCVSLGLIVLIPRGARFVVAKGEGTTSPASSAVSESAGAERVYPIAPGVWYPTDGPLPENPIRYYRVRCWPGCHTGSPHGKYPQKSLDMDPIFPTSTVPGHPAAYSEGN